LRELSLTPKIRHAPSIQGTWLRGLGTTTSRNKLKRVELHDYPGDYRIWSENRETSKSPANIDELEVDANPYPLIRSQKLYPIELPAHTAASSVDDALRRVKGDAEMTNDKMA
jgi:hypothetical protein